MVVRTIVAVTVVGSVSAGLVSGKTPRRFGLLKSQTVSIFLLSFFDFEFVMALMFLFKTISSHEINELYYAERYLPYVESVRVFFYDKIVSFNEQEINNHKAFDCVADFH